MKKLALALAVAFLTTSTPAVAATRPSKPAAAPVERTFATLLVTGRGTARSKPAAARARSTEAVLTVLSSGAPVRPSKPAAALLALAR